eukprot:scaffold440263_cov40-Prasinocladus_malaysianus.AAC.1
MGGGAQLHMNDAKFSGVCESDHPLPASTMGQNSPTGRSFRHWHFFYAVHPGCIGGIMSACGLRRTEALIELGEAAADLEAMQATLADSAAYCRYLRDRCSELEHKAATLSETRSQRSSGEVPRYSAIFMKLISSAGAYICHVAYFNNI